jgi:peptidoglycan/LPS O-acetylase OafA/YrhL
LRYLSEAAYPVYILHLPVLTAVSYLGVRLEASVGIKYALIVATTFAVTFLLYEAARRVQIFRFLLGMKTAPSARPLAAREEPARA